MSQKKSYRNRLREFTNDLRSAVLSGDNWKTILAHLVWSLPPEEIKEHLVGAGPKITVSIVDACNPANGPNFKLELATEDAVELISDEVDADMIQVVTDQYFEILDPFFADGFIASLSVDRPGNTESHTIVRIHPEDYEEA